MLKNNLENIGILGGSFDPPHKGHLYISTYSLKVLKLKKIIWVITKKNPLKENPFFSLAMRKKLCNKIIKKYKKIYLKHYENKLKSTKSIALVRYLKKKSNYKIFFIIGSDNLINFHKWKNLLQKLMKIIF